MSTVEEANRFLRDQYIACFNGQFTIAAEEKGTAFRQTSRTDLDRIFTVQTERVVGKDNTVAIADRFWQIGQTRSRHSLAGNTVMIHEHLNGEVSIRFAPHVVGRLTAQGEATTGQLPNAARFPLSHRADDQSCAQNEKGARVA